MCSSDLRSKQRPRKQGNPDLRRPHQCPSPEIPQVIEELKKYLEPRLFTPLKYMRGNHEKIMRDRLPVVVALLVSLVYRQIAGLSEAVRVLNPTFRTLSVTTSQKRKGRESKYLSRGVSWRQAAGN